MECFYRHVPTQNYSKLRCLLGNSLISLSWEIREQYMNSAKQCMNSAKQCVNSEPIWGYCSRAEKKKKKAENVDTAKRQETRKPNTHYIFFLRILYLFKKKMVAIFIEKTNTKHQRSKEEAHQALQASYWGGPYLRRPIYKSPWNSPSQGPRATNHILQDILCSSQ